MLIMTQPWLIDDLIPLILNSDDHWWPRDLHRLAQVSSAWVHPIRKRLYTCPTLLSFRACTLLARTLSETPSLLPLIIAVDLRPVAGTCEKPLGVGAMKSLRYILSLEGLQSVTLGGELAIKAERFLHSLANPHTVHELSIDGSLMAHSLTHRPSLEWDEVIAFKFATLRNLKLTHLELDIIYPSVPYQLQLSDLILDNVNIASGHLSQLLHDTTSLGRLCVLTKSAAEYDEHIKLVLQSCAITTLHYEVQGASPSRRPLFGVDTHSLPSLRCLHINGIEVYWDTLVLFDNMCPNLEKLSILGRMVHLTPREWAEFIGGGAFSSLRYLHVPWGTNSPPFARWSTLGGDEVVKASGLRNIDLSWEN